MALKIVKGSIDRMFDKSLQDLVRGIRNHKEDEVKRAHAVIWIICLFVLCKTRIFSPVILPPRLANQLTRGEVMLAWLFQPPASGKNVYGFAK